MHSDAYEGLVLSAGHGSAKRKDRNGTPYLAIYAGTEWQQELRNQRIGANYVSFTLNASHGTIINVDGAVFIIESSERDPRYAAVLGYGTGSDIDYEAPWMLYGGSRMAPLDLVTVKVDHKAGTWDIWFGDALVAKDMPLISKKARTPQIRIIAGKAGAMLCGVVCTKENPLFEDANDNAVPDTFEQKILGARLSENATAQTRANLWLAWEEEKATRPPFEFVRISPSPDRFPEKCSPEGQVVHGMPDGLKFGAPRKN